jgi:hypothetical protein
MLIQVPTGLSSQGVGRTHKTWTAFYFMGYALDYTK